MPIANVHGHMHILLMNSLDSHSHTIIQMDLKVHMARFQILSSPLDDVPTVAPAKAEQVNIPEKISKIHQFQTQPQQSKI